jgi:hypothetical protein
MICAFRKSNLEGIDGFPGCRERHGIKAGLGTGPPAKRYQKARFQAAQYAAFRTRRKTYMDINTLLIIVVVVLLLGGGGWYGRGRWF